MSRLKRKSSSGEDYPFIFEDYNGSGSSFDDIVGNFIRFLFGDRDNPGTLEDLFKLGGKAVDNYIKGATGSGMQNSTKETIDYETGAQNWLDEQAYERNVDFYQRFQSPSAMARQYRDAGLNVGLMYGGVGSPSATSMSSPGSAGSASNTPFDAIGQLLRSLIDLKSVSIQEKKVDSEIKVNESVVGRNESETQGVDIRNANLQDLYDLQKRSEDANIQFMNEQIKTEPVKRALIRMEISDKEAEYALKKGMKRLQTIDLMYHDQYMSAMTAMAEYESQLMFTRNRFEEQILRGQINLQAKQIQLLDLQATAQTIENGIIGKQFLNYDSDRRFNRWTTGIGTTAKVVSAVGTVALGGAGLSAAGAARVASAADRNILTRSASFEDMERAIGQYGRMGYAR